MKVTLEAISKDPEKLIIRIARVSSTREDKAAELPRLINHLIKNKHWSPFEHAHLTFEIETSRAIGTQFLRHRSFSFQEVSQRYSNVTDLFDESLFEDVEVRKAGSTNRQSSLDVFDPEVNIPVIIDGNDLGVVVNSASGFIKDHLENCKKLYVGLIEAGVATECARAVLPLTTKTVIYMTGNIRSWIHFLELRDDSHAQKEAQLIAKEIKKHFIEHLPIISKALGYV